MIADGLLFTPITLEQLSYNTHLVEALRIKNSVWSTGQSGKMVFLSHRLTGTSQPVGPHRARVRQAGDSPARIHFPFGVLVVCWLLSETAKTADVWPTVDNLACRESFPVVGLQAFLLRA